MTAAALPLPHATRPGLLRGGLALFATLALALAHAFAGAPAGWYYVDADGTRVALDVADDCDNNVTSGGAIGSDATGCANPTFQPALLTNVTAPTGGSGPIEYLWMVSYTEPLPGRQVEWTPVADATGAEYLPAPTDRTTYYMRCARRAGCTQYAGESNYVTVTIDCCDNVTDGGRIGADQFNCGLPYDPALLRNVAPATGGSFGLTYAWYTSETADVFAPGSPEWDLIDGVTTPYYNPGPVNGVRYFVRAAQREFCTELGAWSNVVTVSAFAAPTVKVVAEAVTCFGAADGVATATLVNVAAPFTAEWRDDAAAGLDRSGLTAGTYFFDVTDANGCTRTDTAVVETPEELTAAATAEFDECDFNDDARVEVVPAGGIAPYTYLWSTGEITRVLTAKPAGTYDVEVRDANNCLATASVTVAPPARLTASQVVTQPVCYAADGAIDVTVAGGTAPYAFAWDDGATTEDRSGLAGGDYAVTVTDANACTVTLTASLDDTPPIALQSAVTDLTCNGASDGRIDLEVSGGTPGYTFAWSNGATTEDIDGLSAGTYTVTVTDNRGCTRDLTAEVEQPTDLSVGLTATQPACAEDGTTLSGVIAGGTPPYTFQVELPSGSLTPASPSTGTFGLTSPDGGTYTATVTDAAGCVATASVTVDIVARLELNTAVTDASCDGAADGSATVTPTGGETPYTYAWTTTPAQTSPTASNLVAGDYTVTVRDARGCERTADVRVEDNPPITTTVDVTDVDCNGAATGAIDLGVFGGTPAYTYLWSTGATTQDLSNLAAGTYTVDVTDGIGCTERVSATVAEPAPVVLTATPTQAVCAEDGASIDVAVAGGTPTYTYTLRSPSGVITFGNFAGATTLAATEFGTYGLVVADQQGCSEAANVVIDDVQPIALTTAATDATCPSSTDGEATVTATGGRAPYAYRWGTVPVQTSATATGLAPGTYAVTVTDDLGCARDTFAVVESVSDGPLLAGDVDSLDCAGDANAIIDLTVTNAAAIPGPVSFAWFDNGNTAAPDATTEDRAALPAGTYRVVVTDGAGCFAERTFEVVDPAPLTCDMVVTSDYVFYDGVPHFNVSRYGAADGAATANVTGGSGAYTFAWSNTTEVGQSVTTLPGGTQSVIVTDAKGCTCQSDEVVLEPSLISDYTWIDEDGDGIQDASEVGLEGVDVSLFGTDFDGHAVNLNTTSDANGFYSFDQLPRGNYEVFFLAPGLDDYVVSPRQQGGPGFRALDSDIDADLWTVARTVTADGSADEDTDAGFIPTASTITIGDYAWYDEDHDGIQDDFEAIIQGISLTLYRAADDFLVATVVTNENGNYAFEDVPPGTYYIVVDQSTSSVAQDFVLTLWNEGADEAVDSDFRPSGRTNDFTVAAGDPDIDYIDVGLHADCPTVAGANQIGDDEEVCEGAVPLTVSGISDPANAGEYRWIRSEITAAYQGPRDPNWTTVPGATDDDYTPSILATTVHYIRLVGPAGCVDQPSASNVVTKSTKPTPLAEIAEVTPAPSFCMNEDMGVRATAVAGATYAWDFGTGAAPATGSGVTVDGVTYPSPGNRTVRLVTTLNGCTSDPATAVVRVRPACLGLAYQGGGLEVALYPNPATDLVRVAVATDVDGDVEYQVFNLQGRLVRSGTTRQGVADFDVSDLSEGTYMFRAVDRAGTVDQQMIVKQ